VFGFPFSRAACIAGRGNIPRPEQIDLRFAFDNENRMIVSDSFASQ
jgi:hypothetical protein